MSISSDLKRKAEEDLSHGKLVRGYGKILFFENITDIKDGLAAGWSRKEVYEQLQSTGKIPIAYVTFCRYVSYYCS